MANRYWVGGTATWNATAGTKWALTSGGAGGQAVPTAADDVFFDAASGAVTCTISGSRVCLGLNCTGFTGTLTGTSTPVLTISNSMTLAAGMTFNSTSGPSLTFNATTTGKTLTTAGQTLRTVTFDGVGGAWTLQDAFTSNAVTTLTNGTLALGVYTYTTRTFSSANTNTRTLDFGTGKIVCTSTLAETIWTATTVLNLTVSGTPLVETTGGGATAKVINNFATGISFSLLNTAGTIAFTANNSVNNLTINASGTTISNIAISIYGDTTVTAGTLTAGTNAWTFAKTTGTQTLSAALTLDFPITHSAAGTLQLASNTVVGSAALRAITQSGGTLDLNGYTLSGFYALTNTATITGTGATLTTSGASAAVTQTSGTLTMTNGAITAPTITFTAGTIDVGGATLTSSGTINWNGGTITYTSVTISTVNFTQAVAFDASVPTSFSATGTYTLTSDTLTLNGATLTVDIFSSNNSNARTIAFGSGSQIALTGNAATILDLTTVTNLTITGTAFFNSTYTGATGTRTFVTGGGTAALSVATSGSTGIVLGTTATDIVALSGGFLAVDLTGFTNTLSNTARTIFGNLTLPASGGTFTAGTAVTTFAASSGTQTLTANGRTLDFPLTHSAAGTLQLAGNTVVGSAALRAITQSGGTFDLNGYTLSGFYSLTSTATLSAVSATLTTAGTGALIALNGGSATLTGATVSTVGFTQGIAVDISTMVSFTCTGTYTLTSNTLTLGSSTLTVGVFSSSNTNVRSIDFGTGKIQVTGTGTCWSCATVTNFSKTGTDLVEITNSSGTTKTIAHGSTAGGTEARAVSFTILAGSGAIFTSASHINNITYLSAYTGVGDLSGVIYGNAELSTSQTTGTASCVFAATSGVKTISTNGRTINSSPVTFNGVGGSWQLQSAFVTSTAVTFTNGAFDGNGYNFTAPSVALGVGTKTINMGGGSWALTSTGTVWNMATNLTGLTFAANGSPITLASISTTARTFAGGGLNYSNLVIGGATGTSVLTITGSNTFALVSSTKTVAHTISLTAGTTQTVSNWTVQGSSGNRVTINSTVVGTQATITKTGGGSVSLDWLILADNNATPANTWAAGANSYATITNGTPKVTGWGSLLIATVLTSGVSWTSPTNWNSASNNTYMFGGGGGGAGSGRSTNSAAGGGGGGGAYTRMENMTLAASTAYTYAIGAAGTAGVAGATSTAGSGGATTFNDGTNTYTANGGTGGSQVAVTPASTGGIGGAASTITGVVVASFAGGNGGAGDTATGTATVTAGGGAGGAGGPNGVGGNGGDSTGVAGGGGGGNGGGSAGATGTATFGAGGNNFAGTGGGTTAGAAGTVGGGGAGGSSGNPGGAGGAGTDLGLIIGTYGGGGGGGGGTGAGGLYGGGGGGAGTSAIQTFVGAAGAVGLVIVTFTTPVNGSPPGGATGNFFLFF